MSGFGSRHGGVGAHRAGIHRLFSEPPGGTVRWVRAVTVSAVCVTLLVAGAAPSQASAAVSSESSAAASRDLPRREMNDEVFKNDKGWLIFKGNVDPGWNNKRVQIYKRLCKGCEWNLIKKTATDGTGRWRTRIYAPRTDYWYWKGIVPQAGGYGKSVTQIYRTYIV